VLPRRLAFFEILGYLQALYTESGQGCVMIARYGATTTTSATILIRFECRLGMVFVMMRFVAMIS
jgi:hypothetical protein